jgi:uncharacterized membrane protein
MDRVEHRIEVDRDVRTTYNQWTQFEDFPKFMEGVTKVVQEDDQHLHWEADIGWAHREWRARVTEQEPDRVIGWQAVGDVRNDGRVAFEPVGVDRTRVSLTLQYDPQGFVEKLGDALNVIERRVQGDLQRFKEFIESRPAETGAWRGEIHSGAEGRDGAPGSTVRGDTS